jgi:hypothetical protein
MLSPLCKKSRGEVIIFIQFNNAIQRPTQKEKKAKGLFQKTL